MDRVDKQTRSAMMSKISSTGNASTERKLRAYLVSFGIRGWRMHLKDIPGKPDFVFLDWKIAVFIDGCFWHYCPICGHLPKSNKSYWNAKIKRNRNRDMRISSELESSGWKVVRIWEHELKQKPLAVLSDLRALLG